MKHDRNRITSFLTSLLRLQRCSFFLPALVLFVPGLVLAGDSTPLRWGADAGDGVPYVFRDTKGNLVGFEVDLKDALARELGREIEPVQCEFETIFPGLERGDFDFAMNGLEITPENMRRARFTRPYYVYQLQLQVRRGERRFRTLDELKEKGLRVSTLSESAAARLLDRMGIDHDASPDQKAPYEDLKHGRVQAVLLDLPVAIYYAAPDPNLKYNRRVDGLEFAGPPFAEGFYGIAVKKDNEALARQLNEALARLLESGEIKRILQKWELWNVDQYRIADFTAPDARAEATPFSVYFPMLLWGALVTVGITVVSMALAILLGLAIALARLYGPWPLRWLAVGYVEFFRGIPVLLLLYFLYYGLADMDVVNLHPLLAAIVGFGLNYAAYEAEIYRAGISSIPLGQWEAAASLGMSPVLTFRRIILPQAVRVILPPMTNDLVALFKDTSVVSVITVVELTKQYEIYSKSAGYLEIGLVTAGLYLVMSVPLGYLSRHLEKVWHV